jgi:pteridine reductase
MAPQVRVNAVAPGPILWPDSEVFDSAARENIVAHTLLSAPAARGTWRWRYATCWTTADYVTGQVINVDGGRTAHL